MARARNLKPALFKNEILGVADPLYTILFEGLWCNADREGRLEDRPMRLKAEIFPYREGVDLDGMLAWLASHKDGDGDPEFIIRYSIGGQKYIQIINFKKHQNPHQKEIASTIPAPGKTGAEPGNSGASPADSLNPLTLTLNPINSAEPQSVSTQFITLTLNTGEEFPIYQNQIAEWGTLFPAVDVPQELREMRAWCLAKPRKRKTKRGILTFVTSWLARAQDEESSRGSRETHRRVDNSATARVDRATEQRQRERELVVPINGKSKRID